MSDDPFRKKSMREQVEEYKRRQREAEGKAQDFRPSEDTDDDHAGDGPDHEDDWDSEKFRELGARANQAVASGPNLGRLVGGIFTLVGVLLLVTSAAILWFTTQSMAVLVEAPGVVVKNELRHHKIADNTSTSSSRGSADLYHAVVEFRLTDGAAKTVEMASGHWPKAYDEGEAVTVQYDPKKPLTARIKGSADMDYFPSIITGFMGFIFTTLGLMLWRLLGRR